MRDFIAPDIASATSSPIFLPSKVNELINPAAVANCPDCIVALYRNPGPIIESYNALPNDSIAFIPIVKIENKLYIAAPTADIPNAKIPNKEAAPPIAPPTDCNLDVNIANASTAEPTPFEALPPKLRIPLAPPTASNDFEKLATSFLANPSPNALSKTFCIAVAIR